MAPDQCFRSSNLTNHGYTSDHKDSYYNSISSSRAKALPSENIDAMSEMPDPSGDKIAELMRAIRESEAQRVLAEHRAEEYRRQRVLAEHQAEDEARRRKGAEAKLEHTNGPLQTGEYLKECHMAEKNLNVTTNLAEATTGPVADASGRRYPHFIRPWIGFPEKQKEILDRLPSDHTFTSSPGTTKRLYLQGLGHGLNPIASEISLGARQDKVVIEPLRVLLEEIRLHAHLQESLGIHGEVKIDYQMDGDGTSTDRSQSTNEALGKCDLFCSFRSASASDTSKFILKWMAEIKPPHKLEAEVFQMALPHGHVIDLRKGTLGDNECRNTVVEMIIQLYSAMVEKNIRYGYTDTGRATLYIRIDSDPSILYYHLSCPSSDVDDDDRKMHLSAISQRLAFTVQAIQAPDSPIKWVTEAEKLPQWGYKREEETLDSDSRLPNHSADEVENEEKASDSDSVSDPKKTQNLGMHNQPDSRRKMQNDFVNRSYCTHECLRGLAFGTPLDKNCPNVKDHGSKHIDRQEFLRLIRDQLDGEKAHDNCEPINASGHIGCLFKIRLLSHGYTLVTKAVGLFNGAPLLHEEKMYNHLRDLQGRFIPACPGRITLKGLFRGEAYTFGAFRHFLFLSYAGKPVLNALPRVNTSVVSRVLEALAQLHQRRVMHRDAAPRNMLYDARTGKYMVIDLERSEPIDGGVPEAVDVHIQKGKRKWEDERESEPFATESKALLARLSSSIRASW
ncbi:hypothetical protein E4U58_004755 [Claviceps cyperi]|nr:hypothetical protein E4U58_004755 [Claviceps cyperi]